MRRTPLGLLRGPLALVAAVAAMAPVAAHAEPAGAAPASATEHPTLDGALGAVGLDRAGFAAESALADRLADASADYAARFPAAFAGVRIDGGHGLVGVVRGADDEDLLVADARARGFSTHHAPAPARDLARTADRVESWRNSLPRAQRDSVSVTGVDPASGAVTVVVDEAAVAPVPPADLGAEVRRDSFRPAQSGGSSGGGGSPIEPTPPPTTGPLPADALLGGSRIRTTDPSTGNALWCSLGFNGMRDGRVVNITAEHCSAYQEVAGEPLVFRPGTVSETVGGPVLGRYTAAEADADLDAALISIDPEDAPRFRNSHVRAEGGAPLEIRGHQVPVAGQTVCKYGQRSQYTCGTVNSVDSPDITAGKTVLFDLCVLTGDSGGVIFSGSRALAVTSMSNAWRYSTCADAEAGMAEPVQAIGASVSAILDRFPGLRVGAL